MGLNGPERLRLAWEGVREDMYRTIRDRYDSLRERGIRPVVAPIKGDVCGVCKVRIPATELGEHKRGVKAAWCGNCKRFLGAAE